MKRYRIGVVGGGIWGLSTAFHLGQLQAGADTVVIERNDTLAAETTKQSAGQVGQLRGDPILARAVGYTLDLLGTFRERTGYDPSFTRSGSVHVALNPGRAEQFAELEQAARQIGYPVERLSAKQAAALVPDLIADSIQAALHVPQDGYVDAPTCALAYGQAARDQGVTLLTGTDVVEISVEPDRTLTLTTARHGQMQVERLVLTGGPWTQRLARQLGYELPMHPIRLQQARTEPAGISATHPVVRVPDESCYVRPEQDGYLFGFFDPTPLPIDLDDQPIAYRTSSIWPEPKLIDRARAALGKTLRRLPELPIAQYRQGMMTCTPDGKFVIGPLPELPQVLVATGCGGTGIAASGAVGKWLAGWAVSGDPGEDLRQYAVDRFGTRPRDRAWLRESACATSAAYYRLPK